MANQVGGDVNVGGDIVGGNKTTNHFPSNGPVAIVAIVALVIGLAIYFGYLYAQGFTLNTTPSATVALTPTPTCPYAGASTYDTLLNLIHAEAEAVNARDRDAIATLFDPAAKFRDFGPNPPHTWETPQLRYWYDLFVQTEITQAVHFDIEILDSNETLAHAVSGSRGQYRETGLKTWIAYENPSRQTAATPYGSDHWTFRRDAAGCWVITRLDFNAGTVPFPP